MKLTGIILGLACLSTSAIAHVNGTIKIYDAKFAPEIFIMTKEGKLVLEDGKKMTLFVPADAKIANKNLELVRDFYSSKLSRKSWDNKGSDILAAINVNKFLAPFDITGQRQNAAWAKTRFLFGAGKKSGIDNIVNAIDVVGHEYTHAVIQTSSNLKYEGQSGALNEHLADVFGAIVNIHYNNPKKPFLIGSSILHGELAQKAEALRDMMDPSKGLSPQPDHMRDLETAPFNKFGPACIPTGENDKCGVHILSGIPNKMAALVISELGAKESASLFYNVMTKGLSENSNFADYRVALMKECKSHSKDACDIVDEALSNVGI